MEPSVSLLNWDLLTGESQCKSQQWFTLLAQNLEEFERDIDHLIPKLRALASHTNVFVGIKDSLKIPVNPPESSQNQGNFIMSSSSVPVITDRLFMNLERIYPFNRDLLKVAEKLIVLGEEGIASGITSCPGLGQPTYQTWVNQPCEDLFKGRGEELTRVDTSQWWSRADQEQFFIEARNASPGQKFVMTYAGQASPNDPDYWLEMTAQFEIIELWGQRYRLAVAKDAKPIEKPVEA